MKKETTYTKEQLVDILKSYQRMIDRGGKEYPAVVLDDIACSIKCVLKNC